MHILTLSSDIGGRDFVTGAIKGQLLQMLNEPMHLVDISHQLQPFNLPQAAYVCRNAISHFPAGSFHAILVNLFEQPKNYLLAVEYEGRYYFCPDNGLITMLLDQLPANAVAVPLPQNSPLNVLDYVNALGRACNWLMAGGDFAGLGPVISQPVEKKSLRPRTGPDWIEGQVIFIDRFENVVVNITRELFEEHRRGRHFKIEFKRGEVIDRLSNHYGEAAEGEKLALFNAAGYLEIAINQGNAAGLFGLVNYAHDRQGSEYLQKRMFYQTVKVYFAEH